MNDFNPGLNIHVDEAVTKQAGALLILVPGALLAFLTGVGSAFLWAHRVRSIASRNISS